MIQDFHFLRPYWFFLLPPMALVLWLYLRRKAHSRSWQSVCDPELLPHLLVGPSGDRKDSRVVLALALCSGLALVALAGPAWKQLEQPVFRDQSALVLVLDLSRSMDAPDLRPSRLIRARHKLIDILKTRREGLTALVVFAAEPFVVSPLTQDAETIASQVTALKTGLMPKQGSRPDKALVKAGTLLAQAGSPRGRILLISDGLENVPAADLEEALDGLRQAGHTLSVLGVGTVDGAPVPLTDGGFLKNRQGEIVMPKLVEADLVRLSQLGGGAYAPLSVDDRDLRLLMAEGPSDSLRSPSAETDFKSDQWREEGPWLLLPVLAIAALAFRRGLFVIALWMLLFLPQPARAMDWEALWSRPDQRAAHKLDEGNAEAAATLFEDPQWKAAAHYRAGQYEQSIAALAGIESADAFYNRGNALAQLGRIPEAIAAYDAALKRAPDHEDARYNKEQLQKMSDPPKQEKDQDGEPQEGEEGEPSEEAGQNSEQDPPQNRNREGRQGQGSSEADEGDDSDEEEQAREAENKRTGDEEGEAQQAEDAQAGEENTDRNRQREGQMAAREQDESEQANEQWLRRIPDDPGGLLRRKFLFQSKKRRGEHNEEAQW